MTCRSPPAAAKLAGLGGAVYALAWAAGPLSFWLLTARTSKVYAVALVRPEDTV